MKILYLTSRFPYPLEKGDKLRAFYQIQALSLYHEVHLVSIVDEDHRKRDLDQLASITETMHIIRIYPWERIRSLMNAFSSGLPFQVAWFYSKVAHVAISDLADKIKPDHIFCQLPRMAEYGMHLPFQKTLDYMDSFGIGMIRRANVAKGWISGFYKLEAKRMIKYEASISEQFNHLTIISQQDKEQFDFPKASSIHVVTNGISPSFFTFPKYSKPRYDIVFVGNMSYLPNIESAEYLIKNIFPKLNSKVKILIAGANPANRVKRLANESVIISGWIDDIRVAYADSKIFVAPMWSGTGQQNKILEAMAMGLPCITTKMVNNAIGAQPDKEIVLAETVEEFVYQIERLLGESTSYDHISANSCRFVQQNFDWNKNGKILSSIFAQN